MTTEEHLRRAYNHIKAAEKQEQSTILGRILAIKLGEMARTLRAEMDKLPRESTS